MRYANYGCQDENYWTSCNHLYGFFASQGVTSSACLSVLVLIRTDRFVSFLPQWKEGDEVPESWKDFYKYNPCVPVDYATVHGALEVVKLARADPSGPRVVRLLLRPARYILREPITVQNASEKNTVSSGRSVAIQIETMEHLPDSFCPLAFEDINGASCSPAEAEPVKRRKSSLRSMLNCRNVDMLQDLELEAAEAASDLFLEQGVVNMTAMIQANNDSAFAASNGIRIKRASLVLRTRRHNEPLIRIRQGSFTIRNIDLKHISHGTGT